MKILHIGPVKNKTVLSEKKKGLEIAEGIGPDGPSRSILGLIDGLNNLDIKVGLLSSKDFNYKSTSLPRGVKYLKPFTGKKYNYFTNPKKWFQYIEKQFGVPDIVNFHDVYDFFSIKLASEMKKQNWKYCVTPRGGLREYAQKRDNYKKIIANKLFFNSYLENATFIHALTKEEAIDIKKFNKNLDRLIIVPNGLPKNVYNNKFINSPNHTKKIKIGFIGQLFTKIKGIDLLLDAIKIFQSNEGDKLDFIIVGPSKTKSDQSIINKKMNEIPFKNSIFFKGALYGDNKWKELSSFDVFILPSRTEGMPIVALEAMAFAKPCLFTTGTNMTNFISNAKGGWGVEPDSQKIYEYLKIISNTKKSQLIRMGNNSRNFMLSNFTWEKVAKKYLSSIKSELAK